MSSNLFLPSPLSFVRAYRDQEQVKLDVNRSFVHYPHEMRLSFRTLKQNELSNVIGAVLSRNPLLHYYQGFHDISSVLTLVLGERAAFLAAEKLALFYLRDFMIDSLELVMDQLALIFPLLQQVDFELFSFLKAIGMLPFFALSWVLTWCSHNIRDYDLITRLFDFFIASNPIMIIYLVTSMLVLRRESILLLRGQDPSEVHSFMQRFPTPLQTIDPVAFAGFSEHEVLQTVIDDTVFLFNQYPPQSLQRLPDSIKLKHYSCVNRWFQDFERWDFGELPTVRSYEDAESGPNNMEDQLEPMRNLLETLTTERKQPPKDSSTKVAAVFDRKTSVQILTLALSTGVAVSAAAWFYFMTLADELTH